MDSLSWNRACGAHASSEAADAGGCLSRRLSALGSLDLPHLSFYGALGLTEESDRPSANDDGSLGLAIDLDRNSIDFRSFFRGFVPVVRKRACVFRK
jgi:hypothetical protein